MFSHLFSGTFIANAFWMLIFCMILVPVLYLAYRGAVGIISGLAAGDGEGDSKSGCAGFIVLIIFLSIIGSVCNALAERFITMPKPPSEQNSANPERNRELGPVLIFRKEAPLLYNYYGELGSYKKKQEEYIARLKSEYTEARSAGAREELEKMRKDAEKKLNDIVQIRSRIEDLAGRVHFARYMAALGVDINENSLQKDIKDATSAGANMLTDKK